MKTLKQIGLKEGCDKGDENHTFSGENYFDIYERYFNKIRNDKLNILELGVRDGSSLRIWREYFDKANILGIDINPETLNQNFAGCKVEIMSQDNKDKLDEISNKVGGWDIIIDDASHLNELTKKSFSILWKHIKPKGYYIIEDLKVSYSDLRIHPDKWNSLHLNKDNPTRNNDRSILNELFLDLIKQIDLGEGDVRTIHFYNQIAILQKT